jgi:AcrR family transcriptional regulator
MYTVSTPDRGYHHGDLRRALIDAALELLAESGGDEVSLREVARRAGVSAMAPYRHFADKAALMAAIRDHGLQLLFERLSAADADPDPRRALAAQGQAYIAFALGHPALFRVMIRCPPPSPPPPEGPERNAYNVLRERVKTLVPPDQVDVAVLSAWALVHGLAGLALDGRIEDPDAAIKAVTEDFAQRLATG